jgi:hypothetical protein
MIPPYFMIRKWELCSHIFWKDWKKQVENDEDTVVAGHKSQAFYLSKQYRRSCCMIIAQLCRKSVFAKALLKSVCNALGEAFVLTIEEICKIEIISYFILLIKQNEC